MGSNNNKFYTAGKFAEKAGVTLRTIRYYDKKDLLKPSDYSSSGYRLYTERDLAKLQRILTLKFLGFSLGEIKNVIKEDSEINDFKDSLTMQKEAMEKKIEHMSQVIKAINEAEQMFEGESKMDWDRFGDIIKAINSEKVWLQQFKNSTNLKRRINLHDNYSTNKYGWHPWIFDRIKFFKGARVLELGCGDGSFWVKNAHRLPENCEIILTDISEGMVEDAKRNLKNEENKFTFKVVDAENILFKDSSFDIVIGNFLFHYVEDRTKSFQEVKRVLKDEGYFYSATMGKEHMYEIRQLLKGFDSKINMSFVQPGEIFGMENGKEQLMESFTHIKEYTYDDSLIVTEAEPLMEYIFSLPININEVLSSEKVDELKELLKKRIRDEGNIFIKKVAGIFEAMI